MKLSGNSLPVCGGAITVVVRVVEELGEVDVLVEVEVDVDVDVEVEVEVLEEDGKVEVEVLTEVDDDVLVVEVLVEVVVIVFVGGGGVSVFPEYLIAEGHIEFIGAFPSHTASGLDGHTE